MLQLQIDSCMTVEMVNWFTHHLIEHCAPPLTFFFHALPVSTVLNMYLKMSLLYFLTLSCKDLSVWLM